MPDANHDAVPNANHDTALSSSAANEVDRLLAVRDEARQLARDLPVADNRQVAIGRVATTAAAEVRDAERELADLQRFSPAKLWAQLRGTRAEDIDRQNGVVERATTSWPRPGPSTRPLVDSTNGWRPGRPN